MSRFDSKTLQALMRDPAAMARFQASGELPRRLCDAPASSPLIDLLESIPPRLRGAIKGVKVSPELGYMGCRSFQSAAQALLWLRPPHAGASHPAESWRDKRFSKNLTLKDLLSQCASAPESMLPRQAKSPPSAETAIPAEGQTPSNAAP